MNEPEIDQALEILKEREPHLVPYAQFLSDWRDVVNANSDGWHSWKAGSSCAAKLMELVDKSAKIARYGSSRDGEYPKEEEFRKSLSAIKGLATKKGLTAPTLNEATPQGPAFR